MKPARGRPVGCGCEKGVRFSPRGVEFLRDRAHVGSRCGVEPNSSPLASPTAVDAVPSGAGGAPCASCIAQSVRRISKRPISPHPGRTGPMVRVGRPDLCLSRSCRRRRAWRAPDCDLAGLRRARHRSRSLGLLFLPAAYPCGPSRPPAPSRRPPRASACCYRRVPKPSRPRPSQWPPCHRSSDTCLRVPRTLPGATAEGAWPRPTFPKPSNSLGNPSNILLPTSDSVRLWRFWRRTGGARGSSAHAPGARSGQKRAQPPHARISKIPRNRRISSGSAGCSPRDSGWPKRR